MYLEETNEVDRGKEASIFFCGDFCSTPSTSLISVSENLKEIIASCDLRVCNFEGPVQSTGKASSKIPPNIHQSVDAPSFLESIGFNVISLANNHILDFGLGGYKQTVEAFQRARVIGAGQYNEVYNINTFEINDIKIGILPLSYACYGAFDTKSTEIKQGNIGIACLDNLSVNHIIMKSKEILDFVIVYLHDGIEYIDIPLPWQRERYKDLIDYGADAIIAHHSHTPQGWETYRDRPIFYSLGNFFFNSKLSPNYKASKYGWYNGLVVKLVLTKGQPITFTAYNTLNIDNRNIILDYSDAILNHTEKICDILNNDHAYKLRVKEVTEKFWNEKYMLHMFQGFAFSVLKTNITLLLKQLLASLKMKNNNVISSYMKNANHRNIITMAINRINRAEK